MSRLTNTAPALPALTSLHIVVVAVVRDGAGYLARSVAALDAVMRPLGRVSWLVVESDSDDGTLAELGRLAATLPTFRYVSLGRLRDTLPLRTQRIARARNHAIEILQADPALGDCDFVAMADLDGMTDELTTAAIRSCWTRDDWAMVAANARGPYYDIWALRHPLWSPNDCSSHYAFLLQQGVAPERARDLAVHARMLVIDPRAEWIPVQSAFGGFAIYRRAAIPGPRYEGVDETGREVCEHVAFNRAIAEAGGRLFVNPRLLNVGWCEHTLPMRPLNRVRRQLRARLRNWVRAGIAWMRRGAAGMSSQR